MKRANTKALKEAFKRYQNSSNRNLWQVYKNCSDEKYEAFDYCKRLCEEYNGHDLKIVSFNKYQFTCGFIGEVNGVKAFVYITMNDDRYLPL